MEGEGAGIATVESRNIRKLFGEVRAVDGVDLVTREGEAYRVSDPGIERAVQMTDLENDEAVSRLQQRLRRAGVDDALAAAGCAEGDTVRIGGVEFVYVHGAVAT